MIASVVWLLGMIGAIALTGGAREAWRTAAWLLPLSAAAAALAGTLLNVSEAGFGALAGIVAGWRLLTDRATPAVDLGCGGACAGLAAAMHLSVGAPPLPAIGLPVATLAVGVALLRPEPLRRGAGLLVCALGAPAVAFAPDIAAGWRSTASFSGTLAAPSPGVPAWTLAVAAAALLAGAVRAGLARR